MKLLLDTHLLLWAAYEPAKLPALATRLISAGENVLHFSAASIWEVSIKASLDRDDFEADPHVLRRGLIENGYIEIAISSAHAAAVRDLPRLHRDPFDRMLVAQSRAEGISLLTNDKRVADYGAPVRLL